VHVSDVSWEHFERVRSLLEERSQADQATVDWYKATCGLLYLLKSGCHWRMLPREIPKYRKVHSYFAT
jgi:transposase